MENHHILYIHLLGSPRIEINDRPLAVDTRKAIALLAYLAMEKLPKSRESLAALLWPESDDRRGRGALRRTLSVLKKALGGQGLQIDRQQVELKGGAWVDAHEFESLAKCGTQEPAQDCVDRLKKAAALYEGDFMAGFSLRDSITFDNWQFEQAQRLRRLVSQCLSKIVQGQVTLGNHEEALDDAHQLLRLDRLNEAAHREVMQLYAWLGQRDAAIRQYRQCVRVLEEELGVPPLGETTALYQQIQANQIGVRPQEKNTPSPSITSHDRSSERMQLPFVGREEAMQHLQQAYRSISESGMLFVVEGEAGIGKTRLVEEFLSGEDTGLAQVLPGRCYPEESNLTYGPWVEGLRQLMNHPDHAAQVSALPDHTRMQIARLIPGLAVPFEGENMPRVEGSMAQVNFHEAIVHVLRALTSEPPPLIIVFDNIHWADDASRELFAYVVRRLQKLRVFILSTWRTELVARGVPLRTLFATMQSSQQADSLVLPRLSQFQVRQLAARIDLEGADLVEKLHTESEGLPYFLKEYISMLRGYPDHFSENWDIPLTIRNLLLARVGNSGQAAQQLLSAAAIIGRNFDFELLWEVSGRSEDEVIRGIEELENNGLVQGLRPDRAGASLEFDFVHEKLRAIVYEETSLPRRRLLHRRAAHSLIEAAQRQGQDQALAGLIAHHLEGAGEPDRAVKYHVMAAEHAASIYAYYQAIEHYLAALSMGYPESVILHESLGDLYMLRGEYPSAHHHFEMAAADPEADFAWRLEHKLGKLHTLLGAWDSADTHFESALSIAGDQITPGRIEILNDWSLAALRSQQLEKAQMLADQALEDVQRIDDPLSLAQTYNLIGMLARHQMKLDESISLLEESQGIAESLNAPQVSLAIQNNLALTYQDQGNLETSKTLFLDTLAQCQEMGLRHREAATLNNLADLAHQANDEQAAMQYLKKAVVIFSEVGQDMGDYQPEIWKLSEW